MALTVRMLKEGQLADSSASQSANTVYDLYTVPAGKAAIVKSMRFANIDTASAMTIGVTVSWIHGVNRI